MDPYLPNTLVNFAIQFGNELKKKTSIVTSPLAAQALLALTALGSGGDTRAQLLQAMALADDEAILSLFAYVTSTLQSVNIEGVSLKTANKVYLTNQGTVKQEILKATEESFGPMLEQLNFKNNVGAASVVNKWVAQRTDNMIKDMVSPRAFSYETRMFLANATVFQGSWEQPFMKSETRARPFHVNLATDINVPMMHRDASYYHYRHSAELNAHLLQMNYIGRQASMVLIVPEEVEGLGFVMQQLAAGQGLMDELAAMRETLLDVTVPRFRIHTEVNLKERLKRMGITSMFDNNSDIQMLTTDERQSVDRAIQRTVLVVDEGGRGDVRPDGAAQKCTSNPIRKFIANRPFLYLVFVRRIPVLFGIYEGSEFAVKMMPSHSVTMPGPAAYQARARQRNNCRRVVLFVLLVIIILGGGTVGVTRIHRF